MLIETVAIFLQQRRGNLLPEAYSSKVREFQFLWGIRSLYQVGDSSNFLAVSRCKFRLCQIFSFLNCSNSKKMDSMSKKARCSFVSLPSFFSAGSAAVWMPLLRAD